MDVFGITPELKRENRQYWGRELGMCWQLLVTEVCRARCKSFQPGLRIGNNEPCDLIVEGFAIDTKYRVGSGDSGTLKKFKQYGPMLREAGLKPVFLILRYDNLSAAITACKQGGWDVRVGDDAFDFLEELTQFDLLDFLVSRRGDHVLESPAIH